MKFAFKKMLALVLLLCLSLFLLNAMATGEKYIFTTDNETEFAKLELWSEVTAGAAVVGSYQELLITSGHELLSAVDINNVRIYLSALSNDDFQIIDGIDGKTGIKLCGNAAAAELSEKKQRGLHPGKLLDWQVSERNGF